MSGELSENQWLRARRLIDVLASMPAPVRRGKVLLPGDTMTCLCGKKKLWSSMPLLDTGVLKAFDHICAGCDRLRDMAGMAKIVCVGCRQVIARIDPYTTPSGFNIRKDRCYHIQKCDACDPEATHAQLIEETIWLQKTKRNNYYGKTHS